MNFVDVIILVVVLGGIGFLLYRTMWKPKSMCPGCDGCKPSARPKDGDTTTTDRCCK